MSWKSHILLTAVLFVAGSLLFGCQAKLPIRLPVSSASFGPILRTKIPVPPGRRNDVKDIIVRFYNGFSTSELVSFPLPKISRILKTPGFNRSAPTALYIHGYIECHNDESVLTVVSAYLEGRPDHNILVLDWSNLAFGNYIVVASNAELVGRATAKQLVPLMSRRGGISPDNLHVVGHSLGAHIAGYIGRAVKRAGYALARISGLDPAFPGYYPALLGAPLGAGAARFVDALHTDAGAYGGPLQAAHADFWPNGGRSKQPGCEPVTLLFTDEDFCSHRYSWRFWADSVRRRGAFPARACASYQQFLGGACDDHPQVYMGIDAAVSLRGDYYLTTGDSYPFSVLPNGSNNTLLCIKNNR